MSNLINHAKEELQRAGLFDKDSDYDGALGKAVLELVEVFSKQGHSGMSASLCLRYFSRLAAFEPLLPITGEDSEWSNDISGNETYQNKRLSAVFKEGKDGKPYYIDAIIWRDQKGLTWSGTALDSKGNKYWSGQYINLPFVPKTFYIDVISKEIKKEDWENYIKDESQLEEVFKYYNRGLDADRKRSKDNPEAPK